MAFLWEPMGFLLPIDIDSGYEAFAAFMLFVAQRPADDEPPAR